MELLIFIMYLTGLVSSETQQVTKRKGETVSLLFLKDYIWTFGQISPTNAIAVVTNNVVTVVNGTRFGKRLRLKEETGTLIISNLTFEDSGLFLIQILTQTETVEKEYNLTTKDNSQPPIYALEGCTVTMETRIKELDPNPHLYWTQGPGFTGKEIATWENNIIKYDKDLKKCLSLDLKTGSLTIRNISEELSGFYCVKLLTDGGEEHLLKQYLVTVYDMVSAPHISVMEHDLDVDDRWSCHINCSVVNSFDLTLTWYKGQTVINRTTNPDQSSKLSLPLEIPSPSEESFRCEAENPVSNESVSINTTYLCPTPPPGLSVGAIVGIAAGVILVIIIPVILWWVCKQRNRQSDNINCFGLNTCEDATPPIFESVSREEEDNPAAIPS